MVPRHFRHRRDVRRDAPDRLVRPTSSGPLACVRAGIGLTRNQIQERRQARRGPEPRPRRVHRPLRSGDVDARRVELDLHAYLHLELARTGAHA